MVVTSAVPVLPPDPDLLTPALERTFRGHRAAVLSVGISSSLGQVGVPRVNGACFKLIGRLFSTGLILFERTPAPCSM